MQCSLNPSQRQFSHRSSQISDGEVAPAVCLFRTLALARVVNSFLVSILAKTTNSSRYLECRVLGRGRETERAEMLGPELWEDVVSGLLRIFDLVFGCWHHTFSRPFTFSGRTYEVCLNCGKQFPYSLRTMSLTKEEPEVLAVSGVLPYRAK